MTTNLNQRSVDEISMLHPLAYGDTIELDGPDGGNLWTVYRGQYGWGLKDEDCTVHRSIHDIDGMADFIAAILEWAKAYSEI